MVIPSAESLFIKDENLKDNKKQKQKQNDTSSIDHDEKKNDFIKTDWDNDKDLQMDILRKHVIYIVNHCVII